MKSLVFIFATISFLFYLSAPAWGQKARPTSAKQAPAKQQTPPTNQAKQKKPAKPNICKDPPNYGNIMKPVRYLAEITIYQDSFTVKRTLSLAPVSAWKNNCVHHLKLGLANNKSIKDGKQNQVTISHPPREKVEKKLVNFKIKPEKGSDSPVQNFSGTEVDIPPLPGNPQDYRLILTLEQTEIKLPELNEDKIREIVLPLTQLKRFTPSKQVNFKVILQMGGDFKFLGATIPETNKIKDTFSWEGKKLPGEDLIFLFSEYEVEPEKIQPEETGSLSTILIYVAMIFGAFLLIVTVIAVVRYRSSSE
ncbi:MAG: hypothetical protein ACQES9_09155 [Myxococcota bacterium]